MWWQSDGADTSVEQGKGHPQSGGLAGLGEHLMPWERGQCGLWGGEGVSITLSPILSPHRVSVALSLH